RPLSPALGAEIMGVDASQPIGETLAAQLQDIWHQSLVILLRGQKLSMEDQVRFAECFGPPAKIHTPGHRAGHDAVMLITNVRENGKLIGALPDGEMHLHTYQCNQVRPGKALYVNRLMTLAIEDMPEAESDELLSVLFDHQEQRQFVYEHIWRVGDILMWDNRCTLHARTDFSAAERRLMRRVTILGEKPV